MAAVGVDELMYIAFFPCEKDGKEKEKEKGDAPSIEYTLLEIE
jgi:hypothetical protein